MNHKGLFFTVLSSALLWCLYFFAQWYLAHREYIIFQELYNAKEYNIILEIYEDNQSDLWLHNKWNASFWEYEVSQDISLLEQSVLYFSWSLAISENDDTRFNYEYTSWLLERWDTPQEEDDLSNQNDEFSQGGDSWEQQQDTTWSWANSQQWQSQLSQKTGDQSEQESGSWSTTEDTSERGELSAEERAAIEAQTERLKRDQIYNQKYFWTQKQQGNEVSDVFESFFGSVDRGGEKDW